MFLKSNLQNLQNLTYRTHVLKTICEKFHKGGPAVQAVELGHRQTDRQIDRHNDRNTDNEIDNLGLSMDGND